MWIHFGTPCMMIKTFALTSLTKPITKEFYESIALKHLSCPAVYGLGANRR